jgi:hypothetical protein
METLYLTFDAFKVAFPITTKVVSVTSTQWVNSVSVRVVDLYGVKSGYLMKCSILESSMGNYVLLNNMEMADGITDSAVANAIAISL